MGHVEVVVTGGSKKDNPRAARRIRYPAHFFSFSSIENSGSAGRFPERSDDASRVYEHVVTVGVAT